MAINFDIDYSWKLKVNMAVDFHTNNSQKKLACQLTSNQTSYHQSPKVNMDVHYPIDNTEQLAKSINYHKSYKSINDCN